MKREELKNVGISALVFILVASLAFLILKPVFSALLWAIVIGYLLYPVNTYVARFVKNETLRASFMIFFLIAIFMLPIFVFLNPVVSYLMNVRRYIDIQQINAWISSYTSGFLGSSINLNVEQAITFFIDLLKDFFLSIPQRILGIFIMLFVLFYIFKAGRSLSKKLISLIPVQQKYKKMVIDKFSALVYGSFYALIIASTVQAVLAWVAFFLLHIPLSWLWALLILMAGMLPFIGPAFVYLPLSIYLFSIGSYLRAALVLIFGIIVLSLIADWFLKQGIMSSTAKIHPLITLIGIIGGIHAFGLIGIVLGPLTLIVLKIFFEVYTQS